MNRRKTISELQSYMQIDKWLAVQIYRQLRRSNRDVKRGRMVPLQEVLERIHLTADANDV